MKVLNSGADEAFSSLASEISSTDGATVVRSPAEISSGDTVLYVAHPEEVEEEWIDELHVLLDPDGELGIITGRTVEEARQLYARTPSHTGQDCLLLRGVKSEVTNLDDSVTVIQRGEATVGDLREALKGDTRSLSAIINGKDIHAYLKDGYLCGFPADPDKFEFPGTQPPCVSDGELACPLDGDLLHADDIDLDHVFLNACSSVFPNSEYGLPVNLGLALLSTATSLVGTYRTISITPFQTVLHQNLLRSGYSASERAYVLNRTSEATNLESRPYVALGRPEAGVENPVRQEYRYEHEGRDDGFDITLKDVNASLIDVSIPLESSATGSGDRYWYVRTEYTGEKLFYTAFTEGDDLRVVLTSWDRVYEDEISLEVGHSSYFQRNDIDSLVRNGTEKIENGLVPGKARGQYNNARHNVTGAAKYMRREAYLAQAYHDVRDRIRKAEESLRDARESMVTELLSRRPVPLQYEYQDNMVWKDTEVRADTGCPYCGRLIFLQTMEDVLGTCGRTMARCPNCSYIYDVPKGHEADYPEIRGEFTDVTIGSTVQHTLSYTNPYDRPVEATAVLNVNTADYDTSQCIDRPTRQFELDTSESVSLEYRVDTSEFDPADNDGQVYFEGHVILDDLSLVSGMRTLYVI